MEMRYLTEKDMEYFRKRAALGQVVILEIDAKKLLEMDLKELEVPKGKRVSEDEILKWMKTHECLIEEEHQKREQIRKENETIQEALDPDKKRKDAYEQTEVITEQKKIVEQAIKEGIPEELLKILRRGDLNVEQLQNLYQALKSLR